MSIGERLKRERLKKGWSQKKLGELARVRQATIAELETGVQKETRTDIARRLARVLGVTVDYLVGMYEDDEPGDVQPAGVAVVGASVHAGSMRAQRRARWEV